MAGHEKAMERTANQISKNGSSGFRWLSLRACGLFEESCSGRFCTPGTASPARALGTSRGGVFCLVTLDDECSHSCKQGAFAKKLGLLAKHQDLLE